MGLFDLGSRSWLTFYKIKKKILRAFYKYMYISAVEFYVHSLHFYLSLIYVTKWNAKIPWPVDNSRSVCLRVARAFHGRLFNMKMICRNVDDMPLCVVRCVLCVSRLAPSNLTIWYEKRVRRCKRKILVSPPYNWYK